MTFTCYIRGCRFLAFTRLYWLVYQILCYNIFHKSLDSYSKCKALCSKMQQAKLSSKNVWQAHAKKQKIVRRFVHVTIVLCAPNTLDIYIYIFSPYHAQIITYDGRAQNNLNCDILKKLNNLRKMSMQPGNNLRGSQRTKGSPM